MRQSCMVDLWALGNRTNHLMLEAVADMTCCLTRTGLQYGTKGFAEIVLAFGHFSHSISKLLGASAPMVTS